MIEGNTLTWKARDAQPRTSFKLDPTTTPKTLDLQGTLWSLPVTLPGCYRLGGDALVIRLGQQGKRPQGFPSGRLKAGETEMVSSGRSPSIRRPGRPP